MSTGTKGESGEPIDNPCWPEHIDRSDVTTHLQRCIIQTATIHDDWTQAEIAEHLDCAPDTVSRTLTYHWPEHHTRQVRTETALSIEEVEEIRERLTGDETPPALAEEFDVALQTIRDAAKGKYDYTHAAEHPPLVYSELTKQWVVDDQSTEDER